MGARIEVDGRPATVDDLAHPVLVNFGHFTSMQVRGRRVRGLRHHLDRLTAANRELFGADLDPELVRALIRRALTDTDDASVRVNAYRREEEGPVSLMVTVRAPYEFPAAPLRLQTVLYGRPVPHIKHVGSFGQAYYGRLAARQAYDDALLTGEDGAISETTVANFGFFVDGAVHWPAAPCLVGTTMALLGGERRPIRVADLPGLAGAFVANSNGIAPVGQIDSLTLPVDEHLMRTVLDRYGEVPWDLI